MALDIDTDAMRRASEFVSNAGEFLHPDLTNDVPPCGSDEVSKTVMDNLNARRKWLVAHVKGGAVQADNAAAGITDTANSYDATDAAGAASYGGGSGAPAAPASTQNAPGGGSPAPGGMPTLTPVPDISGTDGESVAAQLEAGPGAPPAVAAATQLTALAGQAHAANASLTLAQSHIVAAGQSEAHPGLTRRLTQAISWTAGVAGHADALAAGYTAAGALHTSTLTAVGPSAGWQTLKTAYADAVMENQISGGLAQPKVDALQAALTTKETEKSTAMSGYQAGGQTASTPPGDLPDPGLNPAGPSTPDKHGKQDKAGKDPLAGQDGKGGGLQDMLGSLMGALGPLTESLGKANPLNSLGRPHSSSASRSPSSAVTPPRKHRARSNRRRWPNPQAWVKAAVPAVRAAAVARSSRPTRWAGSRRRRCPGRRRRPRPPVSRSSRPRPRRHVPPALVPVAAWA